MKIHRQLQLNILKALQNIYPDALLVQNLPGYAMDSTFMGNLFYLREHGLIRGGDIREPGQCRSMIDVEITKDGLDLLENDGGFEAIINLQNLLIDRAEFISQLREKLRSTLGDDKKIQLIQGQLANLPSETLITILQEALLHTFSTSPEIIEPFLAED